MSKVNLRLALFLTMAAVITFGSHDSDIDTAAIIRTIRTCVAPLLRVIQESIMLAIGASALSVNNMKPLRARAPSTFGPRGSLKWIPVATDANKTPKVSWKRVVFLLFAIGCVSCCLYQVISLLAIYFEYPSEVRVSMEETDWLTLPGLTLCNGNS